MTDDDSDKIRVEIREHATAKSESVNYSLQNSYLTIEQKAVIEAIYQFPMGVMHYAIALITPIFSLSFWNTWLLASGIGAIAWTFARFLPGRIFWPIGIAFGGNAHTVICLILAACFTTASNYGVAIYLVIAAFGISAVIELPMWLWTMSSRIHAKYQIAKRTFNITFPFESVLTLKNAT